MTTWRTIRQRVVRDKEPVKKVARELGLSRTTVRKYIQSPAAPVHKPRRRRRALDVYKSHILGYLQATPKITAFRIGTLLRQNIDPELGTSERSLRSYVAQLRKELQPKEAFLRASYVAGDSAQFDFTPVKAIIGGAALTVHLFVLRLSYSGKFFARCSWREDEIALFTGLLEGYRHFGGLTNEAIFDNAKTAVIRILRGRERIMNAQFAAFCGALALNVQFAAPRKGWEKGGVEGTHGFIEDNFFRPIPQFASIADLNAALLTFCIACDDRIHSTHRERIGDRFARERTALRPLPAILPKAVQLHYRQINKFAEVMFDTNRYSVPVRYAHRDAIVEVGEESIRIVVGDTCVAQHVRWFGKREFRLDPQHFAELLAHKHRSARTALIMQFLPQAFLHLRDVLFEHLPSDTSASRAWASVVKLIAVHSIPLVANCIERVLARGSHDVTAITLLVEQASPPSVLSGGPPDKRIDHQARIEQWEANLGIYAIDALKER